MLGIGRFRRKHVDGIRLVDICMSCLLNENSSAYIVSFSLLSMTVPMQERFCSLRRKEQTISVLFCCMHRLCRFQPFWDSMLSLGVNVADHVCLPKLKNNCHQGFRSSSVGRLSACHSHVKCLSSYLGQGRSLQDSIISLYVSSIFCSALSMKWNKKLSKNCPDSILLVLPMYLNPV